jgi:hypothetical protein
MFMTNIIKGGVLLIAAFFLLNSSLSIAEANDDNTSCSGNQGYVNGTACSQGGSVWWQCSSDRCFPGSTECVFAYGSCGHWVGCPTCPNDPPCSPSWGGWGACSKKCGTGIQYKYDGCDGSKSQLCNTEVCAPIISISASPDSHPFTANTTSLISWSTTDAARCEASGYGNWNGSKSISGTATSNPIFQPNHTKNAIDNIFSLKCWNSADVSSEASATVRIQTPPKPTLNLFISHIVVNNMGDSSQLTWTSANASKCLASGSWNGEKSYNGTFTENQTINAFKTFNMRCENVAGDYVNESVSACYKTDCTKDTCIGTKCQECSSTIGPIMVDGTKDCRDENWQEVSPN